jgi:hypothetical protein
MPAMLLKRPLKGSVSGMLLQTTTGGVTYTRVGSFFIHNVTTAKKRLLSFGVANKGIDNLSSQISYEGVGRDSNLYIQIV